MQDEVEAKARELLAAEVSRGQRFDAFLVPVVASEAAIRAIAAAIRQRPVVDDEALIGAIARAWCWEENMGKTVDPILGAAIAKEVQALLAAIDGGQQG